jgi:NAD(P)-dependent dehydrogenase (short-subunit alcohol dehydrogenase family)
MMGRRTGKRSDRTKRRWIVPEPFFPFGSIAGQRALVTGGASGIGLATARALVACGASVTLADRDREAGLAAVADIESRGSTAAFSEIDLADTHALQQWMSSLIREDGPFCILINSAGLVQAQPSMNDVTEELWWRLLSVNALAPLLLTRLAARAMSQHEIPGRIVNVSSAAAFRAVAAPVAYASSKAALVAVTRSTAAELAPRGITVNAVAPGVTATNIHQGRDSDAERLRKVTAGPRANPMGRFATPEDVAAAILFLCMPASRHITAQTIHVSGGAIV